MRKNGASGTLAEHHRWVADSLKVYNIAEYVKTRKHSDTTGAIGGRLLSPGRVLMKPTSFWESRKPEAREQTL